MLLAEVEDESMVGGWMVRQEKGHVGRARLCIVPGLDVSPLTSHMGSAFPTFCFLNYLFTIKHYICELFLH